MILIYMQIIPGWTAGYSVLEASPCTYFINQTAALLLLLNTMR